MTGKPITYVVLSYFPLLVGNAGDTIDLDAGTIDELQDFLKDFPGIATCCLWTKHKDGLRPVLVFEDADRIYDHLIAWSENDPGGRFNLTIIQKGGKYLIALAPDVEKSIDRFKIARQLKTGFPIPSNSQFHVMFQPLYFVSGSSNMFALVKDELPDEVHVGLMDASLINVEDPGSMDPDRIRWIGPFPRTPLGNGMGEYFGSIIDGAEEPTDQSVIFSEDDESIPP